MIKNYLIKCAIFLTFLHIVCGEDYCDESLIRGLSTRAICDPDDNNHPCENKIPPNTLIQINCNYGFTSDKPTQRMRCLANGTFSEKRLPCTLNCGRIAETADILSKGGILAKPSKVPWNVAIYERGIESTYYICIGSIVSPRVVITAAHCFYDHANLSTKVSSAFKVSAGIIMKNDTPNENKNTADVAEIHLPENYIGSSNKFLNDIAFVILKTPLEYNENISAICIPSLGEVDPKNYVASDVHGFVTKFGTNNQLKILTNTKSYQDCNAVNPLASDKFCIQNYDGGSVCRDSSGGGFVTETSNSFHDNKYQLLGVISNTPITIRDCADSNALVAVTSMNYLPTKFVQDLLKAIKEDESSF